MGRRMRQDGWKLNIPRGSPFTGVSPMPAQHHRTPPIRPRQSASTGGLPEEWKKRKARASDHAFQMR